MAKRAAIPAPSTPGLWVLITGVIFGFLTFAFLVGLVGVNVAGFPIPCESRFLIIAILGICAGFATGFLGGYMNATGAIPLPFVQAAPFQVSSGGGVGVLFVILLLGYWLYVYGCTDGPTCNPPLIENLELQISGEQRVVIIAFDDNQLPRGFALRPEFSDNATFSKPIVAGTIDKPHIGSADISIPKNVELPCFFRLAVYDQNGKRVTDCISEIREVKQ